uniref:Methyltransferase n=1 Tax=Steinernema glaseri TaxID=37863 RepID=A0A1I7YLR8_9BILA
MNNIPGPQDWRSGTLRQHARNRHDPNHQPGRSAPETARSSGATALTMAQTLWQMASLASPEAQTHQVVMVEPALHWQSETPGEIVHTLGHGKWLSDSAILRFLVQR